MVDGIIMFVSEIILRLRSTINIKLHQFWRHDYKPIEAWSNKIIFEKARYIHNNPVESGFAKRGKTILTCSARDYVGKGKGLLEIHPI